MSDAPETDALEETVWWYRWEEDALALCRKLERERNTALQRCNNLNRRLTRAEGIIEASGIVEKRPKAGSGGLGRALANYAAEQYKRERDEARALLAEMQAALKWATQEAKK